MRVRLGICLLLLAGCAVQEEDVPIIEPSAITLEPIAEPIIEPPVLLERAATCDETSEPDDGIGGTGCEPIE